MTTIEKFSDLTAREIDSLRTDTCPDCKGHRGFEPGPRGGAGQNVFCVSCGQGFNIVYPRYVIWAQRIGKRLS
jgi:hypothetical protein